MKIWGSSLNACPLLVNEQIPLFADWSFKDGDPTFNHSVAFNNSLICVKGERIIL